MRVDIKDRDALHRLSLVDVRGYLLSQGWDQEGRYGKVATIFTKTDSSGKQHEVLLPLKEELRDYAERMSDLLNELASVEGRAELGIYSDLIKSGFDVVRVRAPRADDSGTIPFDYGVGLYGSARNLVAAAANAAIKPKRLYRGNSPEQAKDYLSTLRLGQTEIGSYVLTMLSPVIPTLESTQMPLFDDIESSSEPFPRSVTRTLSVALKAAKQAATEATASGSLEPFEMAVDMGVSSNLCEAIASLAEAGEGINISVTWSRVRPGPSAQTSQSFTPDNARILAEAASNFRAKEPEPDSTIEGFVIGLDRDQAQFDGSAKIRGFVDGHVRTVRAKFSFPDYKKVIEAHDKKLQVRVDGEIIRRGQFVLLEQARNLIVIPEDDSDESVR